VLYVTLRLVCTLYLVVLYDNIDDYGMKVDKLQFNMITRIFGNVGFGSLIDKEAWLESMRKIDPSCSKSARNISKTRTSENLKEPGNLRKKKNSSSSDTSTDVITPTADVSGLWVLMISIVSESVGREFNSCINYFNLLIIYLDGVLPG